MQSKLDLKTLIDMELNNPSSVKQMYKVNLIDYYKNVETKTFDTFGEAYLCACEYFGSYDVTINDIPFTEEDYEALLSAILWAES